MKKFLNEFLEKNSMFNEIFNEEGEMISFKNQQHKLFPFKIYFGDDGKIHETGISLALKNGRFLLHGYITNEEIIRFSKLEIKNVSFEALLSWNYCTTPITSKNFDIYLTALFIKDFVDFVNERGILTDFIPYFAHSIYKCTKREKIRLKGFLNDIVNFSFSNFENVLEDIIKFEEDNYFNKPIALIRDIIFPESKFRLKDIKKRRKELIELVKTDEDLYEDFFHGENEEIEIGILEQKRILSSLFYSSLSNLLNLPLTNMQKERIKMELVNEKLIDYLLDALVKGCIFEKTYQFKKIICDTLVEIGNWNSSLYKRICSGMKDRVELYKNAQFFKIFLEYVDQ